MSSRTRASPHLRKYKTVLGSGLHAVDSGFKVLGFGFFVSLRIPEPSIPASNNTLILKLTACCFFFQSNVFSHGAFSNSSFAPFKELNPRQSCVLDSMLWIPDSRYWISDSLSVSGFQSLVFLLVIIL